MEIVFSSAQVFADEYRVVEEDGGEEITNSPLLFPSLILREGTWKEERAGGFAVAELECEVEWPARALRMVAAAGHYRPEDEYALS